MPEPRVLVYRLRELPNAGLHTGRAAFEAVLREGGAGIEDARPLLDAIAWVSAPHPTLGELVWNRTDAAAQAAVDAMGNVTGEVYISGNG